MHNIDNNKRWTITKLLALYCKCYWHTGWL